MVSSRVLKGIELAHVSLWRWTRHFQAYHCSSAVWGCLVAASHTFAGPVETFFFHPLFLLPDFVLESVLTESSAAGFHPHPGPCFRHQLLSACTYFAIGIPPMYSPLAVFLDLA